MKPTRTPQNLGSPFNLLDFGAPEGTEIPGLGTDWEPFLEGLTHADVWKSCLSADRCHSSRTAHPVLGVEHFDPAESPFQEASGRYRVRAGILFSWRTAIVATAVWLHPPVSLAHDIPGELEALEAAEAEHGQLGRKSPGSKWKSSRS